MTLEQWDEGMKIAIWGPHSCAHGKVQPNIVQLGLDGCETIWTFCWDIIDIRRYPLYNI